MIGDWAMVGWLTDSVCMDGEFLFVLYTFDRMYTKVCVFISLMVSKLGQFDFVSLFRSV
jgi:hypothetical protein